MAYLKEIIEKPITGEWGTDGNEVNVLRTTNFTNSGILDFSSVVKRNISEKKVEQKKLLKGDIIIEKSGGSPKQPVGRVVFFDEEGVYLCNNFTSILRPKKEKVEPKYLHYLLFSSHRFGITEMFQNKTTGIINLQLPRYINKLEIPLPPSKTQQRIAGILDDAAVLRDKTAELLKEYDLLEQSIFLEMFGDPVVNAKGWKKRKLIQVSEQITDGTHHSPKPTKSGYPYVTAKHIKEMILEFDSKPTFVNKEAHEEIYSRCKPEFNDVFLIKDGATTGVACLNSFKEPISLLSSVGLIKPNKNLINPYFLAFWFNHSGVKQQLIRKYMSGAAIKRYTISKMKKFDLIVPPIKLQNQFAEKINLLEQQKMLAKKELKESEGLFNCLLQKAFKGELK